MKQSISEKHVKKESEEKNLIRETAAVDLTYYCSLHFIETVDNKQHFSIEKIKSRKKLMCFDTSCFYSAPSFYPCIAKE